MSVKPVKAPQAGLRGQLPTAWGAFCAGEARERSLPCQREVPSVSEAEGFLVVYGV